MAALLADDVYGYLSCAGVEFLLVLDSLLLAAAHLHEDSFELGAVVAVLGDDLMVADVLLEEVVVDLLLVLLL